MPNYNLYNQPPQPSPPTAQPAPEPPKSNKLWPINWKRNRFLKILGTVYLIALLLYLLILLIIVVSPLRLTSGCDAIPRPTIYNGNNFRILNPLCAPTLSFYGKIMIVIPFLIILSAILYSVISIFKFRKLDKFDILQLILSIIIIILALLLFLLFNNL